MISRFHVLFQPKLGAILKNLLPRYHRQPPYIHENGKYRSQIDYVLIDDRHPDMIYNLSIQHHDSLNTSDHRPVCANLCIPIDNDMSTSTDISQLNI